MLYNAYHAHKETLDQALSTDHSARMTWGHNAGWPAVEKSVQALQDVIGPHVTRTMEADPMYEFFSQRWRMAESDYPNLNKVQADRARDFSMYQHILQAARKRGFVIRFMILDDFISEEREKYPQTG